MEVLARNDVERFFCKVCDARVDLCRCEKSHDYGCWDCGPDCEIDNRRKAKKALADHLAAGFSVPSVRPSKMLEETEQRSSCCGAKLKRMMKIRRVSGILDVYYAFHVCSGCGLMYYLP